MPLTFPKQAVGCWRAMGRWVGEQACDRHATGISHTSYSQGLQEDGRSLGLWASSLAYDRVAARVSVTEAVSRAFADDKTSGQCDRPEVNRVYLHSLWSVARPAISHPFFDIAPVHPFRKPYGGSSLATSSSSDPGSTSPAATAIAPRSIPFKSVPFLSFPPFPSQVSHLTLYSTLISTVVELSGQQRQHAW
jgi:hypothetical protein